MKFSFMRNVDDHAGMFIGILLGKMAQIKNLIYPTKREIYPEKVKTILCQKYFGMGSILMTLPLINGLRRKYPNAKIVFLTLESNRELLKICKMADEVLTINLRSFPLLMKDVFLRLVRLLGYRIDISIDLEFYSNFSMLISFLTLAKVRVGLHQKYIRPDGLITSEIYYNYYKHITEIYFAYARVLGIEAKPEYFNSLLPSMRKSREPELRRKLNLKHDIPIILINVNASDLFIFRCWPADYFVALVRRLIKNYPDNYYILIGGKSDREYVDNIYKQIGENEQLINSAGQTDLKELFGLVEMSSLMITNDSGPMHIASLYGKNIAVFFGPETPVVYGPLNENVIVFYSGEMYCSPCLNVYDSKQSLYKETCKENNCLKALKPDYVYSLIEEKFLSGKSILENREIDKIKDNLKCIKY